ncbi:ECF RNA polymerase sigma factor SigR [bacterium HR11]|nr:ECF RNA polymerase sigma factor SigR [bacterium HR11]
MPIPRHPPDVGVPPSPEEALEDLQAHEPAAVQRFIELYLPRVYHLAYRMCRQPDLARDAAQEALTIALQKIHQFRGESRLITWLYQILFHECLRSRRESTRWATMVSLDERPDLAALSKFPLSPGPEEQALQDEERRLFWTAVERLPESLRSVYLLREIEGLSTQEVARVLGLSESNVKVRLHRARRRLKNLLARAVRP